MTDAESFTGYYLKKYNVWYSQDNNPWYRVNMNKNKWKASGYGCFLHVRSMVVEDAKEKEPRV